jgi:ribosomal protein L6P/L9E
MDGSPPLYECLQQIILLDLTAPDLILIRGEDGTAVSQMMPTIRTVHKKGKPKKPEI